MDIWLAICASCVCSAWKRELDPLDLEFCVVVSHQVDAGNSPGAMEEYLVLIIAEPPSSPTIQHFKTKTNCWAQ